MIQKKRFWLLLVCAIVMLLGCQPGQERPSTGPDSGMEGDRRRANVECRRRLAALRPESIVAIRFRFIGYYLTPNADIDSPDKTIVIRDQGEIKRIRDAFLQSTHIAGRDETAQLGGIGEVMDRVVFVGKSNTDLLDFRLMGSEVVDLWGEQVAEVYKKYRKQAIQTH